MMLHARRLAGLVAAITLLSAPASYALEPQNDTAPWKWTMNFGDITLYSAPDVGMTWATGESIASAADVDHQLLACAARNMTKAGIFFSHAAGDLDIYVFDLKGNYLGSATGVGDQEFVDVSAFGKQAVVMKVYGYAGATGHYQVRAHCI